MSSSARSTSMCSTNSFANAFTRLCGFWTWVADQGAISCTCCSPAARCLASTPTRSRFRLSSGSPPGLRPRPPPDNFRVESIEQTSFPEAFADAVLCSAVLHFARDDAQFMAMLDGLWRVLRPGGLFFCRLASSIGMEHQVKHIQGRRYQIPDGTERYLVDEALLTSLTRELGGELLDPLKTTVVQNQRCMTTWVLRKVA